jgi:hypothetical protein
MAQAKIAQNLLMKTAAGFLRTDKNITGIFQDGSS